MIRILFICEHNSARSQIAEAYLNHFGGDRLYAESAGLEPGTLNPYVVEALDSLCRFVDQPAVVDMFKKAYRDIPSSRPAEEML